MLKILNMIIILLHEINTLDHLVCLKALKSQSHSNIFEPARQGDQPLKYKYFN